MDNIIVGLTGATCFLLAQTSTNWFESATPLGIVAAVVYFFLWKFDRKLDSVEDTTRTIKEDVEDIKNKIEHNKDGRNE